MIDAYDPKTDLSLRHFRLGENALGLFCGAILSPFLEGQSLHFSSLITETYLEGKRLLGTTEVHFTQFGSLLEIVASG